MLAKSLIRKIVNCELPADEIREHLLALNFSNLDGETLNYFVSAIRDTADQHFVAPLEKLKNVFDCCGTGGSGLSHYNISTMAAFVFAAGDVRVAKFGNRSSKGASGSFDFLEAAGIPVQTDPQRTVELVEATNLGFLFGPQYFPALGKLREVRKSIPGSTIFNIIGPLLNPAKPTNRVLGTFNSNVQKILAEYLASESEITRALVIRSETGLDELDPYSANYICDVKNGSVSDQKLNSFFKAPENPPTTKDNVAAFNALINNSNDNKYLRAHLCLNAGAGFYVVGKASSIEQGFAIAENLLVSGGVKAKFEQYRRACAIQYSR